jgi:hypothetical protein
MELFLIRGGGM